VTPLRTRAAPTVLGSYLGLVFPALPDWARLCRARGAGAWRIDVGDSASRWNVWLARASGQKRWQSHRSPKVLGGTAVAGVGLGDDVEIQESGLRCGDIREKN
jgi:hypothetical protein